LLIDTLKLIVKPIFLQSTSNCVKMKHGKRQTLRNVGLRTEPELNLARYGQDIDPRLLELVRLLARRAAREVYDEQIKGRPVTRS
jgi:hypothetical protein